jgi:CheY-like chemotaxis protein
MDLEMPVMDGFTCARKIRELERLGVLTTRVPIIAVTAYVRPEQIGEARDSGMVCINQQIS